MKYTSTRDATKFYTFEEALFGGYAPDGGLFVPAELPSLLPEVDRNRILKEEWAPLGYKDLATELLHPFIGDEGISREDLRSLLARALDGFEVPDDNLVPVVPMIQSGGTVDCYVAELFHGPTYCFKDLGMRATVFLLEHFASRRSSSGNGTTDHSDTVVLTAATTGDTGPAAVKAVEDLNSPVLGIVVHYPEGQISDFQRKQMTTVHSDRVSVVAFEGGGDDMDRPIKSMMTSQQQQSKDGETNNNNNNNRILVCGVNSYNIGRPLMQLVHFVWTFLRVVEYVERTTSTTVDLDTFRLDIVIPTGAMGNIAGCYMAKKIGVPFGNLCAGVNANDFTHRAFSTGDVRRIDEPMKPSLSDAINIQLPYNLERLLFYLTDQDHAKVKAWYEQLEQKRQGGGGSGGGSFDLTADDNWLAKLQSEFRSAKVLDDSLCDTIQRILDVYGYWVDPHTGVAFGAAEQLGYLSVASSGSTTATANNNPVAVMATASPCKFQAAMTKAVGGDRWSDYETHHFPARGRDLQDQEERPPNRYVADPDKTLEENQLVWEAKTRALIAKLGR